jgi:uncharacterized protein YutE (UPF0331/DUF86 family)
MLRLRPARRHGLGFRIPLRKKIIGTGLGTRLGKAVGFRNIAVHEYRKIDWEIVYAIVTGKLDTFRNFMQAVLTYIQ